MPNTPDIYCAREDPCRVHVIGEVDIHTVPALREKLTHCLLECVDGCRDALRLDISRVDFVDSAGLALFIGAWKRCQESNRQFFVVGARAHIRRVVKITGIEFLLGD